MTFGWRFLRFSLREICLEFHPFVERGIACHVIVRFGRVLILNHSVDHCKGKQY